MASHQQKQATEELDELDERSVFDYSYVSSIARIAVYDDMKIAPRIIDIPPAPTNEFIEALASTINEQRLQLGGKIPYTAIREVTENFIHAQFSEIVVSILDGGNTIRFCDQGPGIIDKEKAQLPGFTSAIEPMKHYIRGVGSGLPQVKDYLEVSHGKLTIEDNIKNGAVVTLSLTQTEDKGKEAIPNNEFPLPSLTDRERLLLGFLFEDGALGISEISQISGISPSSVHFVLKRLEEGGLLEKTSNKKRILTDYGYKIASALNR